MKAVEFCYWLQGFFEIARETAPLNAEQVIAIRNHLALVFKHEIDPSYGGDQAALQAIHDGKPVQAAPSGTGQNPNQYPQESFIDPNVIYRC